MNLKNKKLKLMFHITSIALSVVIVSLISTEASGFINTVDEKRPNIIKKVDWKLKRKADIEK